MIRIVAREITQNARAVGRFHLGGVRCFAGADGTGSPPSATKPDNAVATSRSSGGPPAEQQANILDDPQKFFEQSDARQRKFLKENATANPEMPPDLKDFIRKSPMIVEDFDSTQPVAPRLPRYLRDQDEDGKGGRPDFTEGRIQENLPLMEKVHGFDTVRTTNFSRDEQKAPVKVYQGGDVVDIYDLLMRRENGEEESEDALVEKVYEEYGKKHKLPDEANQERHKSLLKNTLKYLRVPVLMRDPVRGGLFHGVCHTRVNDFAMFDNLAVVPKTTAKYALEDLLEGRQTNNNDDDDSK